jgi:ubiquinone/menaquinone biosynthesis C-methylase UbiE
MSDEQQKQRAIDTHSAQARLFSERYGALVEDPYRNSFVYSRKRLNEWLDRYLPTNGSALRMVDVGCGTGYHLRGYRERGYEICGVDGSPEMLKEARAANQGIEFVLADVDRIPLPTAAYDAALCIEVLRYLPDIQPCLKEIRRMVKPGGVALVTAAPPMQANLYPIVNRVALAVRSRSLTRLKQYFHSARHLRHECARAGFSDVQIHGVYGGFSVWIDHLLPWFAPSYLRAWERIDAKIADAPGLMHFSNMFLVIAK